MILVVNLNPSLDKIYTLDALPPGEVTRANGVQNTAGGKATHVAHVLTLLGESCAMAGFAGGGVGRFIERVASRWGVRTHLTPIAGETRSCLNLRTADGCETEVLEPGPEIQGAEADAFLEMYKTLLEKAGLVVASGSLPRGLGQDFYKPLIELARKRKKPFLLDTSGAPLREALPARPSFCKPNRAELSALLGRNALEESDIAEAIRAFLRDGIELPVVTLGQDGALAGFEGRVLRIRAPKAHRVANAVGSGDAFVAGLAAGLSRRLPVEEALALAAACGTSNVSEPESGVINPARIAALTKAVEIKAL